MKFRRLLCGILVLSALLTSACKIQGEKKDYANCQIVKIQEDCIKGNPMLGSGGVLRDFSKLQVPLGGIDFNDREPYPDRRRLRRQEGRLVHFFATWAPSPWQPQLTIAYGDYNRPVWTKASKAPFDKTLTMQSGDVAEMVAIWPDRKRPTKNAIMLCAILLWLPPGPGEPKGRWVLVRDQPRPAGQRYRTLYLHSFMFSEREACLATLIIP